ncbi:MAG: tripartite tricarboxylate transporter TctB family protein [Alphaproteobacteria bacterium]|nr:tripartite tricarboxylate transporter TctB family protein [Alphaproteobacteria bacterium]
MNGNSTVRGELAVGIGVLALAALVFQQTTIIPVPPYAALGPRAIPYGVAGALAVLGAVLVLQALRGGWASEIEEDEVPPHWPAVYWMVAGLIANVALIASLGFVVASSIQFVLVARAFGSERTLRDAAVGIAITLVAYLGFARLLGINIGAGILEGLI